MSLVQLHAPDFERFPGFHEALAAAVGAELGPGDAIYIPPLWWHHVESLEPFNLLVNYWWHSGPASAPAGFDALVHAIVSLRTLPPATREAWRALFDYYVFGEQQHVTEHIPEHRHGILGKLSPTDIARLRAHLVERLQAWK
jgi:ribosomal protein L16 Arg81 hydroxylase